MSTDPYRVLFICSKNTARSIMAEALLRALGEGRFAVQSAGVVAGDGPHPLAMAALKEAGIPTEGLQSKTLETVQGGGAAPFDFVFTVCDRAREQCPAWTGQPVTGHWDLADPVAVEGNEAERALAFVNAMKAARRRVEILVALSAEQLDHATLRRHVAAIDETATATEPT